MEKLWEKIEEYSIATSEELRLITDICGYNLETLNNVIYARTGYHDIEQFEEYN